MSGLGIEDTGPQLGRNLTYGMLDAIGRAIVVGDYAGSTFPTEAELAKQHGVSRSVPREAGKMLTAQGDRKSVGEGKSVSVRVDLGGRRHMKKKTQRRQNI